jgi:ADP-ribosylglycohydrolase
VKEALDKMNHLFSMYGEHLKYFTELIETAVACSEIQSNDVETIERKLGGGWVAEETATIAIYCTLKYFDNFEEAMIASVNHAGDSDSTGAVTGNILGAALGYEAIPQHFKDDLEMHELILHMADDLYRGKSATFQRECEPTDDNKKIFNI